MQLFPLGHRVLQILTPSVRRFYDVQRGRILCNGKDITHVNVYAYRRHLSLVAQEATLFQGMNP